MTSLRPTNAAILSKESQVWAAKKRSRDAQVKEIKFDDKSRREYLTGFHKRNLARRAIGKAKAQERDKAMRQEQRKELRDDRQVRARENRIAIEKAYGNQTIELDEECLELDPAKGKQKQEDEQEYEDEEVVATVTIVDDLDLEDLHNDGGQLEKAEKAKQWETKSVPAAKPPRKGIKASLDAPPAKKKLSFETKGERLQRKREEKARRVKQAISRREDGTAERRRLKKQTMSRGRNSRNARNGNS
ncbi:hypothetical protein FRB96_007585 [Tulasnella sp. 330]|nr:hypothetical protein FRB96_007585 [Tulasnella sp. 330]KAG8889154.1 hypothetical protein FRB98_005629 [Tulasnella sp. 332]